MTDQLQSKSQFFDITQKVILNSVSSLNPNELFSPAQRISPGTIIDSKYKILSLLGEGGMGAVYKAQHLDLGKEVALKTFLTRNLSPESWKRFQREAQALGRLNHKNIVQVFDFGVDDDDVPFYTMECLEGISLAEKIAKNDKQDKGVKRRDLPALLAIFIAVSEALAASHRKGIVHRDIKPANIFIAREISRPGGAEVVKVVDFGVAGLASDNIEEQKLTSAGTIFGSPLYMSPEQARGDELGPQSDIYSFACSLFECIGGEPPYLGENAFVTMLMHQTAPIPSINEHCNYVLPQRLIGLSKRMLAKEATGRPTDFDAVTAELRAIQSALNRPENSSTAISTSSGAGEKATGQSKGRHPAFNRSMAVGIIALFGISAIGATYLIGANKKELAPAEKKELEAAPQVAEVEFKKIIATRPNADLTPELKIPIKHVVVNGPFLKVSPNGSKHFIFPKGANLGELTVTNLDNREGKKVQASGIVSLPEHCRIALIPSAEVVDSPELMDGFKENDIQDLIFRPRLKLTNSSMEHLKQLFGLQSIVVEAEAVDDRSLPVLANFKGLRSLNVRNTQFTGKALSTLETLPNLNILMVTSMKDIELVIDKILTVPTKDANGKLVKIAPKLGILDMIDCNLNDRTISRFTAMPYLSKLNISENGAVTNASLADLQRLRHLYQLNISLTAINARAADVFVKMPSLKLLIVDSHNWTDEDIDRLEKLRPDMTVLFREVAQANKAANF